MYDTTQLSLPRNAERLVTFLLQLYPEKYRRKFGEEVRFLLEDMYQEELRQKGKVGLRFWFFQIGDITKGVIEQHSAEMATLGMKKYVQQTLQINKYNIIGGVFLLPAVFVFLLDIVSRIAQGDLVHYNRPVYAFISHTPLYWQPVLFTWVIVFPFLAIGINCIPLLKNLIRKHGNIKNWQFFRQNLITILLLGFGTFFILLVKFHDFGPCMVHGIARLGFEHFTHIVAVCKNA